MVAESEYICQQTVAVQYVCVQSTATNINKEFFEPPLIVGSPAFHPDLSRSESALSCSTSICTTTVFETPKSKLSSRIRSGSHTDIGAQKSNQDQHIRIDDLSTNLGKLYRWSQPSSFYGVFDGHGGSEAAAYLKDNVIRFFFEDAELPQTSSDIDEQFMHDLENCHSKSFLLADQALADEQSGVDSYCGTTALTALVLGRHLLVANAGDCRAVLCRNGNAIQLTQDHRPSCPVERKRVEDLGGKIEEDGYLNGVLAVTRALGDWHMKLPMGSASPLTAEPEFQQTLLTDDDEFLILACDGIWDVVSNQTAVSLVSRELSRHGDPEVCAKELVSWAKMMGNDIPDNLTAIIVLFSSSFPERTQERSSRLRKFYISADALDRLRSN